jgi:hypothetical protein
MVMLPNMVWMSDNHFETPSKQIKCNNNEFVELVENIGGLEFHGSLFYAQIITTHSNL